MTGREILDILNSATTFGILVAIVVMLWLLLLRKERRSRSTKR